MDARSFGLPLRILLSQCHKLQLTTKRTSPDGGATGPLRSRRSRGAWVLRSSGNQRPTCNVSCYDALVHMQGRAAIRSQCYT